MLEVWPEGRARKKPKGIYDGSIFCAHCDNTILFEYDDYVCRLIRSWNTLVRTPHKFGHFISGLDYRRLRLFLLSLLWRCSVSTRKETPQIDLGSHSEVVRQMLLDGDAGNRQRYQIFAFSMQVSGLETQKMMQLPEPNRLWDHTAYRMFFQSTYWHVIVSNHPMPGAVDEFCLRENGTLLFVENSGAARRFFLKMADFLPAN